MNLNSSASRKGKKVTQVIILASGLKKTYHHIDTSTIEQGEFTKFETDKCLVMVNTANVGFVEVFAE